MRFLSLFAGIGGFDLGLERSGHECSGQVEIDSFCQDVLSARFPNIWRVSDIRDCAAEGDEGARPGRSRTVGADETAGHALGTFNGFGGVDLLCGGFPCQDLSVAGKRAGLAGERSGLFFEIVRIAKALRPTWGLFENVPGLLASHGGRDFWTVLASLRQCWPAVGYRILDSQHFGVPQRRRRVFLVCGPSEAGVASVLALGQGGERDSEARGEAGTGAPGVLAVGSSSTRYNFDGEYVTGPLGGGNGGIGCRSEDDPNLVCAPLRSRQHSPGVNVPGRGGEDDENLVVHGAQALLHPRSASLGQDAQTARSGEHLCSLSGMGSGGPDDNDGQAGRIIGTLREHVRPGSNTDMTVLDAPTTISPWLMRNSQSPNEFGIRENGKPGALDSTGAGGVATALGVRRLTPTECEALQGFPAGWTCLCQPMESYAKDRDEAALACRCPDSPRYRSLGNAVTVNVIHRLGARLPQ